MAHPVRGVRGGRVYGRAACMVAIFVEEGKRKTRSNRRRKEGSEGWKRGKNGGELATPHTDSTDHQSRFPVFCNVRELFQVPAQLSTCEGARRPRDKGRSTVGEAKPQPDQTLQFPVLW